VERLRVGELARAFDLGRLLPAGRKNADGLLGDAHDAVYVLLEPFFSLLTTETCQKRSKTTKNNRIFLQKRKIIAIFVAKLQELYKGDHL